MSIVISETAIDAILHGRKVKIEYVIKSRPGRWSKAKAYVWFPSEISGAYPDANLTSEEDAKAWKAYIKKETSIMREIIALLGADNSEWSFSRKAGCGCGCSPGFTRKDYSFPNRDHFVNVRFADEERN